MRSFFIKYQDRLIYGTDQAVGPKRDPASVRTRAHQTWTSDWQFLTSGEVLSTPSVDRKFRGLKLPRDVVDKVYLINSERQLGLANGRKGS